MGVTVAIGLVAGGVVLGVAGVWLLLKLAERAAFRRFWGP